ncbi:MAG: chorismate synthase, partial [bacterium]
CDIPDIKSGIFNGVTTGAPLLIVFDNRETKPKDYESLKNSPRPGHADFTAWSKFGGFNDYRGGGYFSGRLTAGLVAAGVIAKKIIKNVKIEAELTGAKNKKIKANDSLGGVIECRINKVPVGLGEPFFDSVESVISYVIFAIPGVKGIEFGAGFKAADMLGSNYNDIIIDKSGKTKTNNAGGINGGISNGNDIVFRVSVHPTPSIAKEQKTINLKTGKKETISVTGRHDACFALRVPVIVEAVSAMVIADFMLLEQKIPRIVE